jgi:hypothetical protein
MGEASSAIEPSESALAIYEELAAFDPQNNLSRRGYYYGLVQLAEHKLSAGDRTGAAAHLAEAIPGIEDLLRLEADNVEWRMDRLVAALLDARMKLESGSSETALTASQAVMRDVELLATSAAGNQTAVRLYLRAASLCAAALTRLDRDEEASAVSRHALDRVRSLERAQVSVFQQALEALLLWTVGSREEASSTFQRLESSGFREGFWMSMRNIVEGDSLER